MEQELNFSVSSIKYSDIIREMALEGKIDKAIEILKMYLSNLSNRDYIKFDEKYVKILFYSIAMNLKTTYTVKSEYEVNREYPDLLLVPRQTDKGYNSIMIEFKYLKKEEAKELEKRSKKQENK